MFKVIDTVRLDDTLFRNQSDLAARLGPGLLSILDPAQVTSAPLEAGASVRIHRPDGVSFDRAVSSVEVMHAVVGLFFADTTEREIPRLSRIEVIRRTEA